jgi:hypothetical protein
MLIRDVLFVLIHKNHRQVDINYTLVESLPDLHMGKTKKKFLDFLRIL